MNIPDWFFPDFRVIVLHLPKNKKKNWVMKSNINEFPPLGILWVKIWGKWQQPLMINCWRTFYLSCRRWIRRSGWSVMIPSIPRAMAFFISSWVFTVQAWIRIPPPCARRIFSSLRTVIRQLRVGYHSYHRGVRRAPSFLIRRIFHFCGGGIMPYLPAEEKHFPELIRHAAP
jgi:hypothetical protein